MEILIILLFILLNGLFSMAEISVVSSRKSRLDSNAKKGSKKAKAVLKVVEEPDKFLSTIQIAITAIGLVTGLYAGEQYIGSLAKFFIKFNLDATFATILARIIVVIATTFVTLVLGELLPKRIGLSNPEKIAGIIIKPMNVLSKIVFPFVWLLSKTTAGLATLLGIKSKASQNATEEEIKSIIDDSADAGEIEETEQEIVNRVFDLSDREIVSLMAPRTDLEWVEQDQTITEIISNLDTKVYDIYPVTEKNLDNIVGVIYLKDLVKYVGKDLKAKDIMREPTFIHESVGVYDVLETFKQTKLHYAFIIDEYGMVQGMITMTDILEALVDNSAEMHELDEESSFVKRDDNSYLIDGQYPFYDFLSYFDIEDKYQSNNFNTISGLILEKTGKVPKVGEKVEWENFVIEVVDLDGLRIDKVLVTENKIEETTEE